MAGPVNATVALEVVVEKNTIAIYYMTILVPISVVLNGFVVLAFIRARSLLKKKDILLVSMAVSDFVQGVAGYMPEAIAYFEDNRFEEPRLTCQMCGFAVTFLAITSIAHLSYMSFERMLSVAKPYVFGKITKKRRYIVLIAILLWIYGLTLALMPLIGWSNYAPEASGWRCSVDWVDQGLANKSYIAFLFFFGFFIPVSVLTFSYSVMKYHLRRMKRRTEQQLGRRNSMHISGPHIADRRHDRMVFVMALAFLVAWTPYALAALWMTITSSYPPHVLLTLSALLAKTSVVVNPIVYSLMYSKLRLAVLSLLFCDSDVTMSRRIRFIHSTITTRRLTSDYTPNGIIGGATKSDSHRRVSDPVFL